MIGVPAGYGIARMRATKAAVVVLIARMTPGLSYLIPLFLLFQWLGLMGTLVPQIIAHLVITVPIVIWIMIGYFETTPLELEEAAVIDGADRWDVFRHVALPIAKPGITVAFILAVIFSWNNFVFGVVLAGRETRTLPVAVYNMLSFEQLSWGPLAAAALIVTLPVLILTIVAQRHIVAGLTAGAVRAADLGGVWRRLPLSDQVQDPPDGFPRANLLGMKLRRASTPLLSTLRLILRSLRSRRLKGCSRECGKRDGSPSPGREREIRGVGCRAYFSIVATLSFVTRSMPA